MTPTETTNTPAKVEDLATEATKQKELSILEKVQSWEVTSNEEYAALDQYLVSIKEFEKMVEADFEKSETAARNAKREATNALAAIVEQKEGHLNKAVEARRIGKQKLSTWEEAEKARVKAEQDRLDAIARKAAEDAAIAAAALAEKSGDREKAAAIMSAPVNVAPAPRLSADVTKRSTKISVRWSATVGGTREDGSLTDPLFVIKTVQAALKFMEKAKTPAAIKATEDLRQAEKDLAYMVYDQTSIGKLAVAGSPYVNGVLKLGGVAFTSRKV